MQLNTQNNMGCMLTLAIVALAPAMVAGCGNADSGRPPGGSGTASTTSTSSGEGTDSATVTTADSTGSSASGGTATTDASSGGSAPTDASSGGSASTGTASDGTRFDLGVPDAPPGDGTGCRKVDFLFVIDNSASMVQYQQNLVANFPAFINGIQATLANVDEYQVGVVTTDEYAFNDPNCQELGSLVIKTGGTNSSDSICGPYANGRSFMTEADDLANTFSCAAQLGSGGDFSELPMAALEETLSKQWNDPGECNEGFLRDDALLVIVVITDENEGLGDPEVGHSPGTPQTWYDSVVASKSNIEENAVVLSLINWFGGPCEPIDPMWDGENIKTFTELFTYGFLGGICEPDYGPIFTQATAVITQACQTFTPPG